MRHNTAASAALLFTLFALFALPQLAFSHAAGGLDHYGCHTDTRRSEGAYHCHRGEYNEIRFRSKADMLEKKKAGITAAELKGETPEQAAANKKKGWFGFGRDKKDKDDSVEVERSADASAAQVEKRRADVGDGSQIVPKGVEGRLRTLKRLHDEGLISEEEYAQKRGEVLGDL
jgi:hypothetical protein